MDRSQTRHSVLPGRLQAHWRAVLHWSRYIDVAVKGNAQGVTHSPNLSLPDLIKEEIHFIVHFGGSRRNLIVPSLCGLQMGIAHIFKID